MKRQVFGEPVPKQREEAFAEAGIAAVHGRARFITAAAVQVENEVLEGRYIVVAAGARPARLKIPGENLLTTSEQFLELSALPRHILFVGGGYIASRRAIISTGIFLAAVHVTQMIRLV